MKPILFAGPLVRALLAGGKTQTRRLPTLLPEPLLYASGRYVEADPSEVSAHPVGTVLWVREAVRMRTPGSDTFDPLAYRAGRTVEVEYVADGERRTLTPDAGWCVPGAAYKGQTLPSIHVPRWCARIYMRVTEVRLERLQSITDEDIRAEGLPGAFPLRDGETLREAWQRGWDGINGGRHTAERPARWDANPWVIAYTFKRVEPLAAGQRVRFIDDRPTAPPDLGTLYVEGGRLHVRWDVPDGEECDEVDPLTGAILGGSGGAVEVVG